MSHVFGPIGHGVYRVSQKVSDVIPVLRLTPIGTQPSAVSVFLSVAKCGGLRSHMYGTDLRTFWRRAIHFGQGVSKGWAKSSTKIRIFDSLNLGFNDSLSETLIQEVK